MNCKDCLHYELCELHWLTSENACKRFFADKSEWVHLPRKPLPLLKDGNPCNTDVYCPSCGENLSGYYTESPLDIVVCFNCGELLDITKAVAKEEAEKAFAERRKDNAEIH